MFTILMSSCYKLHKKVVGSFNREGSNFIYTLIGHPRKFFSKYLLKILLLLILLKFRTVNTFTGTGTVPSVGMHLSELSMITGPFKSAPVLLSWGLKSAHSAWYPLTKQKLSTLKSVLPYQAHTLLCPSFCLLLAQNTWHIMQKDH